MNVFLGRNHSVTIAGFDFRRIGEEAAEMAVSGRLRKIAVDPVFAPGATA